MALFHVNFCSNVLGMSTELDVILPQTTENTVCKTLYLLHGLSDNQTMWQRRTSIERYADERGLAVVMPDAQKSWYTDMVNGDRFQTFIAKEVPAVCRSFFRCMSDRKEHNYIAGLSMGGYGALKIALTDPDAFAGAAAFSGAFDVHRRCADDPSAWAHIFGSPDRIPGSENDIYTLIPQAAKSGKPLPKIYLWCGTEDALLPDTRKAKALLEANGYDFAYSETTGDHSWFYWDREIQNALRFFFD